MIQIYGVHGCAHVFAEHVDQETYRQVQQLMDQPISKDSKVRVMPDCHAGAGCVIGLTMTVGDKVCPNLVGVDIGCGMLASRLKDVKSLDAADFEKLDGVIESEVPSGFNIRERAFDASPDFPKLHELRCVESVDLGRAMRSVGTLGGGNHFIEVSRSKETGEYWLIIHSGSRKLGLEIAAYYQRLAKDTCAVPGVQRDLAFLTGQAKDDYLHDMAIAQEYAFWNRHVMNATICVSMGWVMDKCFTTMHNYIDLEHGILRKGAVSAEAGEELLIPLNMRDGSLLCVGRGNEYWNRSAPHGAGRIMSRSQAKRALCIEEYTEQMRDVYTSCICYGTLDESPMAYKDSKTIEMLLDDTAEVREHLVPVYNFKAGGE